MARTTKVLSFSVPSGMAAEIEDLAKKERRSKSELLREMVHVYKECQAEAEWRDLFAFGELTAKRFAIKNDEQLFRLLNRSA